jgi:hypothetical protein
VKALFRALILLAAAGGFCFALSMTAQADVVEPKSAYQPASTELLNDEAAADLAAPAGAEAPKPQDAAIQEAAEPAIEQPEVAPTPAPEQQVVRRLPTAIAPSLDRTPSLVDHVVHPLRIGVEHLKTSLGRVVSACEVAFGTGAGGPVLVLAVLSMVIPFIRRRVMMTRWATDEDAPEFLYVWELTPPG